MDKRISTISSLTDCEGNLIGENGELLCDRCGEVAANLECVECKVFFCQDCATEIHQKGKWAYHILKPCANKITTSSTTEILSESSSKPQELTSEKRDWFRNNVINEIIETEAEYLKDLDILGKIYLDDIMVNNRFPELKSVSPKGNATIVFSTIEAIYNGNDELYNELLEEKKKPDPRYGRVFLRKFDHFQIYSVFCNHQEELMEAISQCYKTSSAFRTFLDTNKEKPECKGLGLLDFVVKPFQRILKYPLLLKELLKYTLPNHPDYADLTSALEKLQQEVDIINRNKAGADNMKKLLQIQDRVEGWKGLKLLENNRRFIKEGPLLKISKNKQQERYFFLLSDLLIYCAKSKISSNYIFKKYIDLTKMQLEDLADTKTLTNAFQITRTDKNRTYVLIGATSKDKASWIRELELQLAEIHSGGNSHSKSKRSAERPIWRPDVTTENCWKCNGKFTWKNRRHHCRSCGHIFCRICSDYTIELPPKFGYSGPVRVCQDCYKKLTSSNEITILPHLINSTSPADSFKEGYLVKKGHRRRNWNRRFFVLQSGILSYFESENSARTFSKKSSNSPSLRRGTSSSLLNSSGTLKGTIVLKDYTLRMYNSSKPYKFCFCLEGKKTFLIRAENEQDYNDWIEIIGLLAKKGDPISEEPDEKESKK